MLVLIVSMAVTALDQVTKVLIQDALVPGDVIPVLAGLFNLSYVRNTGAAWGMLAGFQSWLIGLSVVMLILLAGFRKHILTDTLCHRLATGLMCAGIIGNLLDRVRMGYVVDFLDFHWRGAHFPSFNVADAAICVGVGLYMLSQLRPAAGADGAATPVRTVPTPEQAPR